MGIFDQGTAGGINHEYLGVLFTKQQLYFKEYETGNNQNGQSVSVLSIDAIK